MVHPYLRRREGREKVEFPHPDLEAVLGKTLGVPLFQEQAMRVAIVCAGFSPGEADQLRRAMATFKFTGGVSKFKEKLVGGMVQRGYPEEFAERTFGQIEGFGSYGFPESHAASFALIAYASSWMKCHHPDVFCCALINSQPMGFYAVAQIVRDAREHGVEIRWIDINRSRWDCTLEPAAGGRFAVRLGMRLTKGLANDEAAKILVARADRPFANVDDLWRRAGVPVRALEQLAAADAFRAAFGIRRRDATWALKGLRDEVLPLFAAAAAREGCGVLETVEPSVDLKQLPTGGEVVADYGQAGTTLREHPVAFLRQDLGRQGISPCSALKSARDGRRITVAGLVLVRQRPGSAGGVIFMTVEDEGATANLVIWQQVFERQRGVALGARMLACRGRVQREGDVIHVIADQLVDLDDLLRSLPQRGGAGEQASGRQHATGSGGAVPGHPALPADELRVAARDFR
jgi:error-prone DNA polymerase